MCSKDDAKAYNTAVSKFCVKLKAGLVDISCFTETNKTNKLIKTINVQLFLLSLV